tara:strand:- start:372 stop:554 length:183 start_codon:yes stop_codon:yes gene_type:complete
MIKKLEFQGKQWQIVDKVRGDLVDNPANLKDNYGCDMVIRNSQNEYFILNEIIDVEFEDI